MKFIIPQIIMFFLGAANLASAAAVPDEVSVASNCWKGCLMKVGLNLRPPCDNAQCACSRAAEFDGPADQCVKSECPAGDLEKMYCAACKDCSPSYRCERCPN